MEAIRERGERRNKKALEFRHKYFSDVTDGAYREQNGIRLIDVLVSDMESERDQFGIETSALAREVINSLQYLDSSRVNNRITLPAIKDYLEIFDISFPFDVMTRLIMLADKHLIKISQPK